MQRPKFAFSLQISFAFLVALGSFFSLFRLYSDYLFPPPNIAIACADRFFLDAASHPDQTLSLVGRILELQSRVKKRIDRVSQSVTNSSDDEVGLLSDVVLSLDAAKEYLMGLKLRGRIHAQIDNESKNASSSNGGEDDYDRGLDEEEEEAEASPLVKFFLTEEIKKYLRVKENKHKKKNFLGANFSVGAIGHACVSLKTELEQFMDYDVGDYCKDDWPLAQKLMVHGCDPIPRRRCLARAPPFYQKPLPRHESLWTIPDHRNVRWSKYLCRNFDCLKNGTKKRGFFKCSDCFNLQEHEAHKWVANSSVEADFLISEVLAIKPGQIRIGLDFSVGVGTFAARMLEHNITIVSSTLNLGAPFNELISLRGLIPIYISINQRLPFFDNTLDILHTTLFFDGWIDLQFLDFIVFDFDRVLRPGGLLWIDRFFCDKKDLDDYLYMFLQLRYKKHKWVITPKRDKQGKEMYFSAVLEKPPRPF